MPRASHPLLRTIGATLRSLRRERGLSQEALADLADIDRSYMSGVERGLRNISVLNLERLAKALDVPIVALIEPAAAAHAAVRALPPLRPEMARPLDEDWEPGRYLSLS
ncbi:MAG TPA: helix-turn-helix transcriptional regulator [Vicinamibacterales bacterium]|nr:helix-turn-helix transcriptional regulator [Vicinamibacterales bacterium]